MHFHAAVGAGPAGLVIQNRGHILGGGEHAQYAPLKASCAGANADLWDVLGDRFVLFGEFMFARHHIAYDALPGLLIEFDVQDKRDGSFLPLADRLELCGLLNLPTVPVLHRGAISRAGLEALVGRFAYGAAFTDPRTGRSDDGMEDLYLRTEGLRTEGGDPPRVTTRSKFVRPEFTEAVKTSDHWRNRPVEPNRAAP